MRPFDNFRTSITDPEYFFGRNEVIEEIGKYPFRVLCLLGGRRIGKTSLLRNIERIQLESEGRFKAFPVFISLQIEQPNSPDSLRFIMIDSLRRSIERYENISHFSIREKYRNYLKQIAGAKVTLGFLELELTNPNVDNSLNKDEFRECLIRSIEDVKDLNFSGILFLFDEAEFVVRQDWSNNAWSYFRGLKDNDDALRPFLGIVLSGYRQVKDYQQDVGSPLLNIATILWLRSLKKNENHKLTSFRFKKEEEISPNYQETIYSLSGGHPYITQQAINVCIDLIKRNEKISKGVIKQKLCKLHDNDFTYWWNLDNSSDGFGRRERDVYLSMNRLGFTDRNMIAKETKYSLNDIEDALEILIGTGVVCEDDSFNVKLSSEIFSEWVDMN